jgi:hypothetical protein
MRVLALIALSLCFSCTADPIPAPDAGTPPAADAGETPAADAGAAQDAGQQPVPDAGETGSDAGETGSDAGETGSDAGAPAADAGTGNTEGVCGTRGGVQCRADEFCNFFNYECGSLDRGGECITPPVLCRGGGTPVCSCDGTTYDNECEARKARASVRSEGACETDACGGIQGIACADENDFCNWPAGNCNADDMAGVCTEVTEMCNRLLAPVCGCDGVTYPNDCHRVNARVQKEHEGSCEDEEQEICGGIRGLQCSRRRDFCDWPAGNCNAADMQGVCVPVLGACAEIFDPVCGCNGRTYGNDCERINARVKKQSDGACQ